MPSKILWQMRADCSICWQVLDQHLAVERSRFHLLAPLLRQRQDSLRWRS